MRTLALLLLLWPGLAICQAQDTSAQDVGKRRPIWRIGGGPVMETVPVVPQSVREFNVGDLIEIGVNEGVKGEVSWYVTPSNTNFRQNEKERTVYFGSGPPGSVYSVILIGVQDGKPVVHMAVQAIVRGAPPKPPPPPGPVDPPPGPVDPPPPINVTGLRVVIVKEDQANMTREQLAIIYSPAIEAWLNANTAKDEKGRPSWRRWDQNVDVTNETPIWKNLWSATRGQLGPLPQIVIVHDAKGETFPLPATEAAALELLKRYMK